jgi:hypothetical protein
VNDSPEVNGSRRLTDRDRAQVEKNIAHLDRLGDLVGGWAWKSLQCRQKGFTTTITFDKAVDVFQSQEFAEMLEQAPALLAPALRRLIELDDELKASTAGG